MENSIENFEANLLNNPESDVNSEHLALQECEGAFAERLQKLMIALYNHCQYKDPQTGRICGSDWQLKAISLSDENPFHNLEDYRLLCSRHRLKKYKANLSIKDKTLSSPF